MSKIFKVRIEKIFYAVVNVVAESADDAENMILEDPQCIDDADFDEEWNVEVVAELEPDDIGDGDIVYDDNLERIKIEKLEE